MPIPTTVIDVRGGAVTNVSVFESGGSQHDDEPVILIVDHDAVKLGHGVDIRSFSPEYGMEDDTQRVVADWWLKNIQSHPMFIIKNSQKLLIHQIDSAVVFDVEGSRDDDVEKLRSLNLIQDVETQSVNGIHVKLTSFAAGLIRDELIDAE